VGAVLRDSAGLRATSPLALRTPTCRRLGCGLALGAPTTLSGRHAQRPADAAESVAISVVGSRPSALMISEIRSLPVSPYRDCAVRNGNPGERSHAILRAAGNVRCMFKTMGRGESARNQFASTGISRTRRGLHASLREASDRQLVESLLAEVRDGRYENMLRQLASSPANVEACTARSGRPRWIS
jgi:hypothetical protein